ncbi:MAG: AAA family ATPase [Candidatus Thorarchaeota archaeon]|jgi:cytidylate kinase
MNSVITLGGLHGTGKSSVADRLANEFNLRRVSAGMIFRKLAKERGLSLEKFSKVAEGNEEIDRLLDSTLTKEAEKGNVILDGQLAAWMAGENSDFNILLTAPLDVRIQRIADRDGTSFDFAHQETITREESERNRYLKYYEIDITDYSVYDLILNTAKYDLKGVCAVLNAAIEVLFKQDK